MKTKEEIELELFGEDYNEEINYESELALFAEGYDEERVKEGIKKMEKILIEMGYKINEIK